MDAHNLHKDEEVNTPTSLDSDEANKETDSDFDTVLSETAFVSPGCASYLLREDPHFWTIKKVSTDGSYLPSSGNGGWAVVDHETQRAYNGSCATRASNDSEGVAIYKAVKRFASKGHVLHIHTDSATTIGAIKRATGPGNQQYLNNRVSKLRSAYHLEPSFYHFGYLKELSELLIEYPVIIEFRNRNTTPELTYADKMAGIGSKIHLQVSGGRSHLAVIRKHNKSPYTYKNKSNTPSTLKAEHNFYISTIGDLSNSLVSKSNSIALIEGRIQRIHEDRARGNNPKLTKNLLADLNKKLREAENKEKTVTSNLQAVIEEFLEFLGSERVTNLMVKEEYTFNRWKAPITELVETYKNALPEWYLKFVVNR